MKKFHVVKQGKIVFTGGLTACGNFRENMKRQGHAVEGYQLMANTDATQGELVKAGYKVAI